MVSVCPAIPIQSLRGHRWVTRLLTFKDASRFRSLPTSTTRRSHSRWCTGDGSTESPVERTEEDYPRIAPVVPRHQRNELKKNILVSPQWSYATEPATRAKYEPKHS